MEIIFANIYQRNKDQVIHGIQIKDKSKSPIIEDNIEWWLISNIIRNHKLSFVSIEGFDLARKVYVDVAVHRSGGLSKYHYIFSSSNEVDKRFNYEGKYYTIRKSEMNPGPATDLIPVIDTIAYSTIEKNKNFSFLISVPLRD